MTNKKTQWILWITFIVLALLDLCTTLAVFIKFPNGSMLETNIFSSKLWLIVLVNVIFGGYLYYLLLSKYRNNNADWIYFYTQLLMWLSFARVLAIRNAISWLLQPVNVGVQVINDMSSAGLLDYNSKVLMYASLIFFNILLPVIISLISWFVFRLSYMVTEKQ